MNSKERPGRETANDRETALGIERPKAATNRRTRLRRGLAQALRRAARMPGQIPFHLVAIQVARTHPSIFDRLDHHVASTYVISPNNMPVVLVLKPQREAPKLTVRYRDNAPTGDAYIAGPLPVLFDLLDQRVDGDALFFSRDLHISGDTEAIVCLRNALDDQPHPITETVSRVFGPAGRHALMRIRKERYGDAGTA